MLTVIIKKNKLKMILVISFVCFIVGCAILAYLELNKVNVSNNIKDSVYSFDANDNTKRAKFLSEFGWQVDENPTETKNIKIPEKFNDTYQNYNKIQKDQGLDLYKHKGQDCTCYTYKVNNYPGIKENINANIIVHNGKLIGGDICSTKLDGFMHGFKKEN